MNKYNFIARKTNEIKILRLFRVYVFLGCFKNSLILIIKYEFSRYFEF